ncbi:MAG: hypothetical protein WC824_08235 [Bacteroidota bacterium]|jgi:hypothetical protein
MSGNIGWGGRDRAADFDVPDRTPDPGFSRANRAYNSGPTPDYSHANSGTYAPKASSAVNMSVPLAARSVAAVDLSPLKAIKTTASNVLIFLGDMTGSMQDWRKEMLKRLALLFKESQGFLGEDLQILFIMFGDIEFYDKIEVAPLGAGPELDTYLMAFNQHANGGGNNMESAELAAYYVLQQVDTSSAKSVYCFIVTDEAAYPEVKPTEVKNVLGLTLAEPMLAKTMFRSLARKASTFCIWADTGSYDGYTKQRMHDYWESVLSAERVAPLDDARRVVDVILGIVAKTSGQYDQFTKSLNARQGKTQYGDVNIDTVHKSISMIPGAPTPPAKSNTPSILASLKDDQKGVGKDATMMAPAGSLLMKALGDKDDD